MNRSEVLPLPHIHQESAPAGQAPSLPVLLVDDNLVNQKVAVRMLETLGYRVEVANNGREALEAVARNSYAAILMDCLMPEMDGFEATAAIKEQERLSSLPIIAMTANSMQGDAEKCLGAGMNAYLAKPVNLSALKEMLEKWIPQTSWTDHIEKTSEEPTPK